jgi:chorismate synthase
MNTFGRLFIISIFGESHGAGLGVTIDGCPAGITLSANDFENDLARRRSGAIGTTPRKELDIPEIFTGVFNNKTTGAPLTILFKNGDTDSSSYEKMKDTPRPGHADFVSQHKFFGFQDYRGGGHFSGRLTAALVAAGVVAKKIIPSISINAKLTEVGGSTDIEGTIKKALDDGDSVGGLISVTASGLPIGLGEPFFDSIESTISHLAFAIPAIKGIEFGSGFNSSKLFGSNHNDEYQDSAGATKTNNAGGISGGISNGNTLTFRLAVKPTSSIKKEKQTINVSTGELTTLSVSGRHDACIALRVPPVAEAITAIALADFILIRNSQHYFQQQLKG